jgi:hypothetical protein
MKRLALPALVLVATAITSSIAYFVGDPKEAGWRAVSIGILTMGVLGTGSYLAVYVIRQKQIEISADELGEKEVVWAKTAHMVHFKSGNPYKFWEAVGGRLFLTNKVLEFRANPAEWWVYRIKIPLEAIRRATPCTIGLAAGGLRVERRDGTCELFTFGAASNVSREWAEAIATFRDHLE